MINVSVLRLDESAGVKVVGKFALEGWDTAFTVAAENPRMGMQTLIMP